MFGSFRSRLIGTVILLIAVTASLVGVIAFVLVRDSLRDQLIEDAKQRAEFNVTTLASPDLLPIDADREDFVNSALVDRFLFRGTGDVLVEFPDGQTFASSLDVVGADVVISDDVRAIVERGEYGYQFADVNGEASLILGARRPQGGQVFYFFDSTTDVDNTIEGLARVLIIAGVSTVVLGALAAGLIAKRVLRPVAVAGRAAGLMAHGDLTVRLPAETNDELGQLAVAFNQMARSLEEQIGELVNARERERQFVADVSHELRTPLTALVNEASMLQPALDASSNTERRVGEMLVADVGRLRALVEDLLEISRLESSRDGDASTEIDVPRFIAAVIDDRHPTARLSFTGSSEIVRTNRRSLERILGNLLDNAASHAAGSPVTVTAEVAGGQLTIDVTDEGPGVAPAELPRLFDRFYKADRSRQGGSGLGLAIAREHARHLGGDLMASPGPDNTGLRFRLRVPVTELLHPGDPAENLPTDAEGEETKQNRRTP